MIKSILASIMITIIMPTQAHDSWLQGIKKNFSSIQECLSNTSTPTKLLMGIGFLAATGAISYLTYTQYWRENKQSPTAESNTPSSTQRSVSIKPLKQPDALPKKNLFAQKPAITSSLDQQIRTRLNKTDIEPKEKTLQAEYTPIVTPHLSQANRREEMQLPQNETNETAEELLSSQFPPNNNEVLIQAHLNNLKLFPNREKMYYFLYLDLFYLKEKIGSTTISLDGIQNPAVMHELKIKEQYENKGFGEYLFNLARLAMKHFNVSTMIINSILFSENRGPTQKQLSWLKNFGAYTTHQGGSGYGMDDFLVLQIDSPPNNEEPTLNNWYNKFFSFFRNFNNVRVIRKSIYQSNMLEFPISITEIENQYAQHQQKIAKEEVFHKDSLAQHSFTDCYSSIKELILQESCSSNTIIHQTMCFNSARTLIRLLTEPVTKKSKAELESEVEFAAPLDIFMALDPNTQKYLNEVTQALLKPSIIEEHLLFHITIDKRGEGHGLVVEKINDQNSLQWRIYHSSFNLFNISQWLGLTAWPLNMPSKATLTDIQTYGKGQRISEKQIKDFITNIIYEVTKDPNPIIHASLYRLPYNIGQLWQAKAKKSTIEKKTEQAQQEVKIDQEEIRKK